MHRLMEEFEFGDDDLIKRTEQYSRFKGGVGEIMKLLRIIEILLVLVSLTWATTRLPFAVRISGEYLRRLLNVVVSHLFIFLLSNVIVLILFFKSRHLFSHTSEAQVDFFIEDGGAGETEEIVYQDKETILEETTSSRSVVVKVHRRSQSENYLGREDGDEGTGCVKELRRWETERRRRVEEEEVDEMSNEEFQRAIEAFIAKHKSSSINKKAIVPVATT